MSALPAHLTELDGWVEIPGLGWLIEIRSRFGNGAIDFWWWHHCPPLADKPERNSLRTIDCSTGQRHAILGGSLATGDLTIGGGSGSIPCHDCGLHGFVRDGKWVPA